MKSPQIRRIVAGLGIAILFLCIASVSQAQIGDVKEFAAFVKQQVARLSRPASVAILSDPHATPTNQSIASPSFPAPAAPDGVKYFSSAEVRASFEKGSPLINKDGRAYSVITGRRDKSAEAELHEKDTDVFYVLEGSATFVTGGKMVDPKTTAPGEVRGSAIEGGDVHTLSKDDVIVIPAGVPHWFKDVRGTFLYFVVKVQ
jgi:mannose-6-phosphate isomerase-like protein (cupin superfamily)